MRPLQLLLVVEQVLLGVSEVLDPQAHLDVLAGGCLGCLLSRHNLLFVTACSYQSCCCSTIGWVHLTLSLAVEVVWGGTVVRVFRTDVMMVIVVCSAT